MNTKVLLTGCNGQVGQSLVSRLTQRDDVDLVVTDSSVFDITNLEQVLAFTNQIQPDVIINAAAYTKVDQAEEEIAKCYAVNADGVGYLAQAAQKHHALLLHISTDYVFDGCSPSAYKETDSPNPQSIYGKSKLAGEQLLVSKCDKYAILRTAWVFSEYGANFVKTMLGLAKDRTELKIVADQFGGPTYAGDIANALIIMMDKMLQSPAIKSDIYHYSGMPYTSWFGFSQAIFSSALKLGCVANIPTLQGITTQEYPTTAQRPQNSRLDCQKINQVFGIAAGDWEFGLEQCLKRLKESQS